MYKIAIQFLKSLTKYTSYILLLFIAKVFYEELIVILNFNYPSLLHNYICLTTYTIKTIIV